MLRLVTKLSRIKGVLLTWRWLSQVFDPLWAVTGTIGYIRYFIGWYKYAHSSGAESIQFIDTFPQLHDRTTIHSLDAHYFYTNGWAMRRILLNKPASHLDVGSQISFANLLAAMLPVTFMDYRPLQVNIEGLECVQGNILALPYADESKASISCLHVAEHIGLGRYGDPIDPHGTKKAAIELARVLAPGGNLFFVVPVGRPRVCFNAHRIHCPHTIRDYFSELELVEFSGVHDNGQFVERLQLDELRDSAYACGMFWFRKPEGNSCTMPR